MTHGKTAYMQLINQRIAPGGVWPAVIAPEKGAVHYLTLGHTRGAIAGINAQILSATAQPVTKLCIAPLHRAGDSLCIGIEQQLVRVKSMPFFRTVRAMHPITV